MTAPRTHLLWECPGGASRQVLEIAGPIVRPSPAIGSLPQCPCAHKDHLWQCCSHLHGYLPPLGTYSDPAARRALIKHVPRYLCTWRPFRGPQGRKGCTRRLVGNQLASHLKSLQVSRLSCILNTLDLMDMLLDLGHISVACLLVPVENKSKNDRSRTEKERETNPIWKKKERGKQNSSVLLRYTPQPDCKKPDQPHVSHSCRA